MKLTIEVLKEIERIEGLKESKTLLVGWMAKGSTEKYLTLESVESFITDNDLWERTETIEGCLLDDYFIDVSALTSDFEGVAFIEYHKTCNSSVYSLMIFKTLDEMEMAYHKRYVEYLQAVTDLKEGEKNLIDYLINDIKEGYTINQLYNDIYDLSSQRFDDNTNDHLYMRYIDIKGAYSDIINKAIRLYKARKRYQSKKEKIDY